LLFKTKESSVVRFQVLTEASMKMAVFWVIAQCSLVEVYRRFRGADVGSSKHLRIVGIFLPDYTAQQPRRQPSSESSIDELVGMDKCSNIHSTRSLHSSLWGFIKIAWSRPYKVLKSYDIALQK
jgi:hypothetical protein